MAYVEAHSTLREHPKTKKLARALNISRGTAIGHLLFLWWWCQDYAKDGNLSTCSAEEIAEAAGWEGDPAAFVEALLSCGKTTETGFLELAPDGALLIHDWYDYGGKLFIQRKQGAVRQANWRARQAGKIPPEDVAPRNENVTPLQDVSNALLTHNVTQSNAYRIDKNREEEIAALPPLPPILAPTAAAPGSNGAGKKQAEQMQALNAKLGPKLRRHLADHLLSITGTLALAETEAGNSVLYEAHQAAVAVHEMGYTTPEDLLPPEDDWYQNDFRGKQHQRPTMKQFIEQASKYKAGAPRPDTFQPTEVYG